MQRLLQYALMAACMVAMACCPSFGEEREQAHGTLIKTHRTQAYEAGNKGGIEWRAFWEVTGEELDAYLNDWWPEPVRKPQLADEGLALESICIEMPEDSARTLERYGIGEPEVAYSELVEGFVYETWKLPAQHFCGADQIVYTYSGAPPKVHKVRITITKTTLAQAPSNFVSSEYVPVTWAEGALVCWDDTMLVSALNSVAVGMEPAYCAMQQNADTALGDTPVLLYTVVVYGAMGSEAAEILQALR